MRAFRDVVALVTELDFQLFGASCPSERKGHHLEQKLLQHMRETVPSKVSGSAWLPEPLANQG